MFLCIETHCEIASISANSPSSHSSGLSHGPLQRCVACLHTLTKQSQSQQFLVNFWLFTSRVIPLLVSLFIHVHKLETEINRRTKGQVTVRQMEGKEESDGLGQSQRF